MFQFKKRLHKVVVAWLVSISLVFVPAQKAEAMNPQILLGLVMAGVAIYMTARDLTQRVSSCSPTTFFQCVMAALDIVAIGFSIKTIIDLFKADRETTCKDATCFAGGGGGDLPTTTLDPGGSSSTTTTTQTGGGPTDPPPVDNPGGTTPTTLSPQGVLDVVGIDLDKTRRLADAATLELSKKGITIDTKNGAINTPRGKLSMSSFGSAAGMKAAGFTDKEIAMFEDKKAKDAAEMDRRLKDILNKLGVDENGEGSGGGYNEAQQYKSGRGFDMSKFMNDLNKKKKLEKPSVAGLAKQHGTDMIGVASDNIFQMVSRSYNGQRKESAFVETDAGPRAAPAPAQIPVSGSGRGE